MFIQTEETPNPATLKFLPGRIVLETGTAEFKSATECEASPLASSLFRLNGVEGVFFGHDFISITKSADKEWQTMKPLALGTIMDHFVSNRPVMNSVMNGESTPATTSDTPLDAISEKIVAIIETRIRPAVAQDGGDIVFDRFEDGIVFVQMRGACSGCPSSTATLKSGIENLLKHFVPEVTEVRAA